MAQKKITDLQLRSSVTSSLNFPSDDGIQSYRVTASQILDYMKSFFTPKSNEISNLQLNASVSGNALTVALKTQAGSDATASDSIKIGFRSSTLTSGAFARREITGALSLTVSSGSKLGTTDGGTHYLYVYALDNGGTVELAISGMLKFDEGQLWSTTAEGGAGAADSGGVLYSTTARTSKAIRLIGRIRISEATAGTWATAPSEIAVLPFSDFTAPTIQRFTSGSGTYTTPTGVKYLRVKMVSGGGGSAGSGTTGQTGGSDGVASTFGSSLLTCNPGAGAPASSGSPVSGGAATVNSPAFAIVTQDGGKGGGAAIQVSADYNSGSPGGGTGLGPSTPGGGFNAAGVAGVANTGAGAGGAGCGPAGSSFQGTGGGGGAYIDAIIPNPSATYSYAVGAGGSGGGAGTSGFAGAAGGSGIIIVEEYYQ